MFSVPPTPDCCKGLDNVKRGVKTFEQRKYMCICLSTAAAIASAPDPSKYVTLPQMCGVTLFAPVGPKFDCNSIKL
ncbi:unnamed protein product [Thlaspi arvense]|uniref:Bifunctional inhibitor/plant lipid transfer protein/seed storage helical domain-containing protein n=1 Tax=Thlaspi arvense TaxID=13288 RepID=A0AAU9RSG1_THLAR|nr:unnamed protein product [Thlaspi arvense]